MFILYAIPLGLVLGAVLGGRIGNLAEVRFRWAPLAILGLAVQVVLFSTPVASVIDPDVGVVLYVVSTAAAFVAVLRNLRVPGVAVIAVGALSNAAAILANGGVMPASPEAVAALGMVDDGEFSNSVVMADPALRPLTDIFALPAWLPAANVFSVGDVLIGLGVVILLAAGMRARPASPDGSTAPVRPDTARPAV